MMNPMPMTAEDALTVWQERLYQQACEMRPVKHLMAALLERHNLEAALERVRGSEGAGTPGVDGVTCAEVRGQPGWVARLADDLYRGRYRHAPPRWVEIPKPGRPGQVRRLAILTVRDRVVHAALKQLLEPILDPTFLPASFGFRPGRSVAAALAEAVRMLAPGEGQELPFGWAAHLDVADCFDTVDHRLLLGELRRHVADADLLALVEQVMQAGGTRVRHWFWKRGRGLLQGSALSPLLCNLALHPLDEEARALAQATHNGVAVLRYADDLLVLGRDARLAERAVATCRQVLGRLQQGLRSPVAAPRPIQEGVDWLGVRLGPRLRCYLPRTAFGYVVPDEKVAAMLARLTEMTTPPSDRIDPSAFNLARWIVSINTQLRDWRQAYLYADNAREVFEAVDEHAQQRVGLLLRAVTGARLAQLHDTYRVKLPRGFSTWEVPGGRLVVLSSLAPQCPGKLVREPAWARPRRARAAPRPAPRVQVVARPTPPALPAPPAVVAPAEAPQEGGA
jgi:group II intron reverse transcriptase/maturase